MAAEHDEALMELYFDKGTLTQDDIRSGLKIGVSKREVMPIFCTSGKRDIGTKRLMEFIINVAPGPQKAPAFLSTEGEEITAHDDDTRGHRLLERIHVVFPLVFVASGQHEGDEDKNRYKFGGINHSFHKH